MTINAFATLIHQVSVPRVTMELSSDYWRVERVHNNNIQLSSLPLAMVKSGIINEKHFDFEIEQLQSVDSDEYMNLWMSWQSILMIIRLNE
jgi:hypothetical protein